MKQFKYTITDPLGIHARPAGMLAKAAGNYEDTAIIIEKADSAASANRILKLMSMGIKQGDTITITAEGAREDEAIEAMRIFFEENL